MNEKINDLNWKEKNTKYLNCIQRFLDRADNIENEKLKQDIINSMLKCDDILTQLAQEEIIKAKAKSM